MGDTMTTPLDLSLYSISSEYYSLNSPDPASTVATASCSSPVTATPVPSSSSSSSTSLSADPPRRRVNSYTPGYLAPWSPPKHLTRSSPPPSPPRSPARSPARSPVTPHSSHVLSTPDPANAVQAARQSVQFAPNGPVNWSRPIPTATTTTTTNINTTMHRARVSFSGPVPWSSSPATSLLSPSPVSEEGPSTPPLGHLPPGAAAPMSPTATANGWAVVSQCQGMGMVGLADYESKCKGLGMVGLAEYDSESQIERPDLTSEPSSRSSSDSEGSLAGESMHTASSSSTPSTPTRLQFVSDSFEGLWNPATLEELRSLKAAAAELDKESQRLRRMRGREPAVSPRLMPRKKVPIVRDVDLSAKPKTRRPAVRHSLITSPHDGSYALFAEPLSASPLGSSPPSGHPFRPSPSAAATRRPFYAQGKASMSVIEFSPRKEQPSSGFTAFGASRRQLSGTIPTLASLRAGRERQRSSSISPPMASTTHLVPVAAVPSAPVCAPAPAPVPAPAPAPVCAPAPVAVDPPVVPAASQLNLALPPPPPPPQPQSQPPAQPERTLSLKASTNFLNRHKKLSRFLGKAQVA